MKRKVKPMASKRAPKKKTYPTYSSTRKPRDLSIARDLEAMRRADPMKWRERVVGIVRSHDGNVSDTATELGIGYRTIVRWLEQDDVLRSQVVKIREQATKAREIAAKKPKAKKGEDEVDT